MFKLNQKELKEHVLKHWALQYNIDQSTDDFNPYPITYYSVEFLIVYRNLKALPENCVKHQIDNIIGNDSWTSEDCSFCGKTTPLTELIQPDSFYEGGYDRGIVYICEYCISAATDIIKLG